MDAREKVISLQKAYADIILNISKEAAARVMSSERRAVQHQHELKVAKEEALRMLLHLKKMMDARTSEAEAAALNQQKKIEELEAQLQEAEDIVKDLREELGEVQAELERLKKSNLQNVNEPDNDRSREVPPAVCSYESRKSRDESAVTSEMPTSNSRQQNDCSECYSSKKDCMCSSHMRSWDLPSVVSRDNYKEPELYRNGCTQRIRACESNMLDKNDGEELEKVGQTGKAPSFGDRTRSELENKLLADVKLSSFRPFRRKRKRTTKQRETAACLTTKLTAPPQKPDDSSRHILVSVKEDSHSSETPLTVAPVLSPDEVEKMVPLGGETGFVESLSPSVCQEGVENDDTPSNSKDLTLFDTTKGLPSQPVRERIIKYTFQRKRKRGAPSESKTTVSPEKEIRNGDKKSSRKNQEPSRASLLSESSRDSRRLAQVARQLISLSEKKWWH